MLPSILTTISFACSALCGGQASRLAGGLQAGLYRTLIATAFLTVYGLCWGQGLAGPGFPVFFLSGLIGCGIGDLALFQAFSRIGSRRTILLCQCLAAPVACWTEWIWLGTRLSPMQILWGLLILTGVTTALAPSDHRHIPRQILFAGIGYGIVSALGQGWGAVLSRHAFALNKASHLYVNASTATFQRMLGGFLLVCAFCILLAWKKKRPLLTLPPVKSRPWLLGNALAGPVIGVSFYQWALGSTPSGIVLAIVATTPIAMIPLSWWLEGDRPTIRGLTGAAAAVTGVIGLILN